MIVLDADSIYMRYPRATQAVLVRALIKALAVMKSHDACFDKDKVWQAEYVLVNFLDEILDAKHLRNSSAEKVRLAFKECETTLKSEPEEETE